MAASVGRATDYPPPPPSVATLVWDGKRKGDDHNLIHSCDK